MTNQHEALRPCPFCGGEAQPALVQGGGIEWAQVECVSRECGAVGPTPATEAEAIAAWNARPAPQGEVAELVARLRHGARGRSEAERRWAEAKSLRQTDHEGPPRSDLYSWPTPEETDEWKAADMLTRLSAEPLDKTITEEVVERVADIIDPYCSGPDAEPRAAARTLLEFLSSGVEG